MKRFPKASYLSSIIFAATIILTISACEKAIEELTDITGTYCTYRDGFNGPVSSELSIAVDTSDRNDFIISNISGYTNSSQAFLEIGVKRIADRLVILPYTVLIGNGNNMSVEGQGDINQDGSIKFEITITQDEVSTYILFLNSDATNNSGDYSNGANKVSIGNQESSFVLIGNQRNYNFIVTELENNGCGITIPRQETTNIATTNLIQCEAELYYTGDKLIGEIRISRDNWQSEELIDLDVQ